MNPSHSHVHLSQIINNVLLYAVLDKKMSIIYHGNETWRAGGENSFSGEEMMVGR